MFLVLWGLWFCNYGRARYAEARELGGRLLGLARLENDSGRLLEAHHALWATLSAMGEPIAAGVHAEQGVSLYDPAEHAGQAFVFGGHDPGVCARYHLGLSRWLLGYPDQGLAAVQDAVRLAERLSHPFTTTIALCFGAWVHYLRGEFEAASVLGERASALAAAHALTGSIDDGEILRARIMVDAGGGGALLDEIERGREARKSARPAWRDVILLCLLADAHGKTGQPERGLAVLGLIPEEPAVDFLRPEVLRIRGELLRARDPSGPGEAEQCFRRAIEVARGREARSLELRAALSLGQLLAAQGRSVEARREVAPVYAWFTEGLETEDLRAARAFLARLS